MDIFTYFKRSNIKNGATKIYPRWLGLVVFLLEFLAVFIVYYFRKIQKSDVFAMVGLVLIYIIGICEFYIRYKIKMKYFSKGFEMGKNTEIYLNKVKMLFPTSILVTIGCCINIFYGLVIAQRYTLYDVYWIWMVPIVVLLVLEPFWDITTGFNDEFVLSDRQIINLSYIQDVRVSKERATTKGTVYEVEFWKNGEKIGTDRYFDEDFFRIKKYLLNKC